MLTRRLLSVTLTAALVATTTLTPIGPAAARNEVALRGEGSSLSPQVVVVSDGEPTRRIEMGFGRSVIVELPRDATEVFVANPRIANAVVRTSRRLFLVAGDLGSTNVIVTDSEGRTVASLDVVIARDMAPIRAALRAAMPNSQIEIRPVEEALMLVGVVNSPAEAQQAVDLVRGFVDKQRLATETGGRSVINALHVRGRDQVMIRVTVSEIQRDVLKQLGIDLRGSVRVGNTDLVYSLVQPFTAGVGQALSNSFITGSQVVPGTSPNPPDPNRVTADIRAMERAGVMRTLAEPNLTAVSGETATFLAGGEFPVPIGQECVPTQVGFTTQLTCRLRLEFKKFGVGLNFTPTVLSPGRISMRVVTEASEISSENSFTFQQQTGASSLTVPSIKTRRAETTVEIPSGGTLVLGGMIEERTRQQLNGVPGLQSLPVLGALFRSRDYVNRQSELVIMATPFIVRPTSPRELSRPDEGFADASDPQTVLFGRLNRVYGGPNTPTRALHGRSGFIFD